MAADTSNIKGTERKRAEEAYEYAKKGKELGGGTTTKDGKTFDSKTAKEYKSYTKKIPMMIKTNGLGATVAFIKSKAKSEEGAYQTIYNQLGKWLMEKCVTTSFLFENKNTELVEAVIQLPSDEYRAVTLETLALMAWVSRFAEGLIQGETNENE